MPQPDPPAELYARLSGTPAPADLSDLLTKVGDLHRERGELDAAAAAYQAALVHGPSGPASLGLGILAMIRGEPGAEAHFEAALEALRASGDWQGAATAQGNLAAAALAAGRVEAARAQAVAALDGLAVHSLPPDPIILINLARAHSLSGDPEAAAEALAEARRSAGAQGRPHQQGLACLVEGELARDAGDLEEAVGAFQAASELLAQPGDRVRALLALAEAARRLGDRAAAISALEALIPLQRRGPVEPLIASLVALGGLCYDEADVARALVLLDEAHARLPEDQGGSATERRLRRNRGLALVAAGRLDEAEADLARAEALVGDSGDPQDLVTVLAVRCDLLRYRGRLAPAIELQARIAELCANHGVGVPSRGLVSAVEDRSLNLGVAGWRRGRAGRDGPVLMIAPAAHGATGPLFPRGAVSVASFLQHHGIPTAVLPLAWHAEPHLPPAEARRRARAALRDAVESLRPRAVGISVTFSYLYPEGQRIAEDVRALDPDLPILIGGPHVTYQDEACLRETPAIDVVVRGEGEWTALELIRALDAGADLSGVAGLTFRRPDGGIQRNDKRPLGSVLELPPEDFGLLPAGFCRIMDISALTSRGCAYRCRFCHEFRYWGGVVREHPVQRVIDEMARLSRYDNLLMGIDDSMLDMRTPYFHALVEALGRSEHVSPNFGLLTRLDTITPEGAAAMRRAGMRWVCVGVESGSPRVLQSMNKEITVEQIRAGLRLVREAGLSASGFLIIGHPGDSPEESVQSRGFVDDLFKDDLIDWLDLSTFSPYPGTPFFNTPERHGVEILTRDWSLWRRTNRPVAQLSGYSAEQIYLELLRMLALQDRYVSGRQAPPALGSGAGPSA